MIREKILRLLDNEIPHGIAVVIEEFQESDQLLRIRADIYCEREAHKKILIGHNGEMLKKIGSYAREDMEKFFQTKVFLDLWVKVKENWRENDFLIHDFGFKNKEKE
jgi:GTP-binding protein Era